MQLTADGTRPRDRSFCPASVFAEIGPGPEAGTITGTETGTTITRTVS